MSEASKKAGVVILLACLGCSISDRTVAAETLWLPVLATQTDLGAAVAAARRLGGVPSGLILVDSSDCQNFSPGLLLIVPRLANSESQGRAELTRWRDRGIAGAYLRACKVRSQSLLAFGLPLLDQSIEQRPANTVNWTYADALSRIQQLRNGAVAAVVPYYHAAPEDVREGLRIEVKLMPTTITSPTRLAEDCIDPEFASGGRFIALSCARAVAADNLLHDVRVYALPEGKQVLHRQSCRAPQFVGESITCRVESIDQQGHLNLTPRRFQLRLPTAE